MLLEPHITLALGTADNYALNKRKSRAWRPVKSRSCCSVVIRLNFPTVSKSLV